jgi:hypothetical protein
MCFEWCALTSIGAMKIAWLGSVLVCGQVKFCPDPGVEVKLEDVRAHGAFYIVSAALDMFSESCYSKLAAISSQRDIILSRRLLKKLPDVRCG